MKRLILVAAALLLAACARKNIENKEAIREAVIEYLSSRQAQTGLDVRTMDVEVTAMAFERDTARATVAFRIKNGDAGMQLPYTLERNGNKWVVQPRQDAGAHGTVLPGANTAPLPGDGKSPTELPPGHPTVPPKQ